MVGNVALCRIWRNDFEVAKLAEREQGVAGAPPGMNASHRRAHSEMLLHELYAAVEVARAEKEMVDSHGIRSQVSGVRSQVLGLRSQVSGDRSQVSGDRSQVTGYRCWIEGLGVRLKLFRRPYP